MFKGNNWRIILGVIIILSAFVVSCSDDDDDINGPSGDPMLGLWSETYDYPLFNTKTQTGVDTVLTTKLQFFVDSFDLKTYDESYNVVYFNNGSYTTNQDTIIFDLNIPSNTQYQKKLNYDLESSSRLYLSTSETSGFIWGASFGPDFHAVSPKNSGTFTK